MTPEDRFQRLFRGRETMYGQFTPLPDGAKKASTYHGQIPDLAWARHLAGQAPGLGICPSTLDNTCYFGAIDLDDYTLDIADVAAKATALRLPLVACRSRSGGVHLFVFLKDPAPAKLLQARLLEWAAALGYKRNPDGRPIEVFPKNDHLGSTEDGNWINLPYYGRDETTRYAVLPDDTRLSFSQFLAHAEDQTITSLDLEVINAQGSGSFHDGPPCLQTLHGLGFSAGMRNQGLFNAGIYFKLRADEAERAGRDPGDWELDLADYNVQHGDPPLPDEEVSGIVKSLKRRAYIFRCGDHPLAPHCKKTECRRRTYGIGAFSRIERQSKQPTLTDLRKLSLTPPRWLLVVEGTEVQLTTDELMNQGQFRKVVLERCHRLLPALKGHEWDELLANLLPTMTVLETPEDAGTLGQFKALVFEFLGRRRTAEGREALLSGLPVEEGNITMFRSTDLTNWLKRRRFNNLDSTDVYTSLRAMGLGHKHLRIQDGDKETSVQVWYLPTPEIARLDEGGVVAVPDLQPAF